MKIKGEPNEIELRQLQRWCWLRAIEWAKWPLFVTQPLIPWLFFLIDWWVVIIVLIAMTFLWFFVRYKYISIPLAKYSVYFVRIKWISSIVAGLLFYLKHLYLQASLSLFWPFLVFILIAITGSSQIGVIERNFATVLGIFPWDNDL